MSGPSRKPATVVSVCSSSKKAGKSTFAAYLVRELGADCGLKVSSGGTHATVEPVTGDPEVIGQAGTDTGRLVVAGAKHVLWVNAPAGELGPALDKALAAFPPEGTLVVEGNSALAHLSPDFAVFLMNVPFEGFKPSAFRALDMADLVLVNSGGQLRAADPAALEMSIRERARDASILSYADDAGKERAWREAVRLIRGA